MTTQNNTRVRAIHTFGYFIFLSAIVLSQVMYHYVVPHSWIKYQTYKLQKTWESDIALYKRGIEEGIPQAIYSLGNAYHNGYGVRKDYVKARELYEAAAAKGEMIAQYNLGNMYRTGEGVEIDLEKAIYYYELSAAQGYNLAFSELSKMYKNGMGVEKDLVKAKELEQQKLRNFGSSISYDSQINQIIKYQLGELKL